MFETYKVYGTQMSGSYRFTLKKSFSSENKIKQILSHLILTS